MSDYQAVQGSVGKARPETRRQGHLAWLPLVGAPVVILPVATAIGALVLWQVLVDVSGINHSIMPPPTAVWDRIVKNYGLILTHAVPTTIETLVAFGVSVPVAVVLGALMTYSKAINQALYPNLVFFQLIPKIALAPLFIVWFGIGLEARVSFSFFISFFPILIGTAAGLQAVDRDMLRLCRSFKATEWQVMLHVRFPYSLPFIFSGMKVAVTLAIIGIVVGEFIASQAGIGYLILFASSRQQTDVSLACIVVLCVIGLLLYGLVVLGEMIMEHWYGSR